MYTHTAALHSARRLAASLLASTLLAGLSPPPVFCRGWGFARRFGFQRGGRLWRSRRKHSPCWSRRLRPEVRCPYPFPAKPKIPPGPGSNKLTPGRRGFVLSQAENGGLPTLFAGETDASQTWMDLGAGLGETQQPKGDGSSAAEAGSAENPYLITTPEQLGWFAYQVNEEKRTAICGKLVYDISLKGRQWVPSAIATPARTTHITAPSTATATHRLSHHHPRKHKRLRHKKRSDGLGFSGTLCSAAKKPDDAQRHHQQLLPRRVTGRYCCMGGIAGQISTAAPCRTAVYLRYLHPARKVVLAAAGDVSRATLTPPGSIKNCFSRLSVDTSTCIATSTYGICAGGLLGRSNTTNFQIESCYVASSFSGTGHILIGTVTKTPNTLTSCYYEDKTFPPPTNRPSPALRPKRPEACKKTRPLSLCSTARREQSGTTTGARSTMGYPLPAYQQEPSWEDIGQLLPEGRAAAAQRRLPDRQRRPAGLVHVFR